MKILLHACCGPCSLEPVRLLRAAGHDLTIAYLNSNIAPADEYARRLATLRAWAADEQVPVVEGAYDPAAWEASAGRVGEAAHDPVRREARCRACYRLRFEEAAALAAEQGFDAVGTTLSVSPYQYTDVIREELERAASAAGVRPLFEDYRPFYDEATHRSRSLRMYRQNYCGCRFSDAEAAAERAERKAERAAARKAEAALHAAERAAAEAERIARKAERAAYDAKQARKRAVLRARRLRRQAGPQARRVEGAARPGAQRGVGVLAFYRRTKYTSKYSDSLFDGRSDDAPAFPVFGRSHDGRLAPGRLARGEDALEVRGGRAQGPR